MFRNVIISDMVIPLKAVNLEAYLKKTEDIDTFFLEKIQQKRDNIALRNPKMSEIKNF